MARILQRHLSRLSACGVHLRLFPGAQAAPPVVPDVHQDDYYLLGWVDAGVCRVQVDFHDYVVRPGRLLVVRPGQVHQAFPDATGGGGLLAVDALWVGEHDKAALDRLGLTNALLPCDEALWRELRAVLDLLRPRLAAPPTEVGRLVTGRLASVFVGMVAEAALETAGTEAPECRRAQDIALAFRHLLSRDVARFRRPSYYASQLHLSTSYLNEAVRGATGLSVSRCIRSELVLQAKRLLAYSDLRVGEVAERLGVEDYAYFSRLFVRETGLSPSAFRRSVRA